MQFGKFEEKAMEFLKENNTLLNVDKENNLPLNEDTRSNVFTVYVNSAYKIKRLSFETRSFMFEVRSDNLEDLFDKAFRVLKSYTPKAIRTKSEDATENKGGQE